MKILFLPVDNHNPSGSTLSMAKLASILQNTYHHKIYVVFPEKGNAQNLLDKEGIHHIIIKSFNWVVPDLKQQPHDKFSIIRLRNAVHYLTKWLMILYNHLAVLKIVNLIEKEKIDIVHINTSYNYVGACAALKANIPYVWHIREFMEEDQGYRILLQKMGYELMKKASTVITISTSLQNKYAKILGNDKVVSIYNGIDHKKFLDAKHEPFNNENLTFIMVGTLLKNKGQNQAIMACSQLVKDGFKNFRLKIFGQIVKNSYVSELIKLIEDNGLTQNVTLCGTTLSPEIEYRNSDIVFMCSTSEAFGRVTVEGMLSGALVIGANSAGTREILIDKKTGLLYQNENIDELTACLEYAIKNRDDARNIAKNGQVYALSHFTAEINAENIDKCYKGLFINT